MILAKKPVFESEREENEIKFLTYLKYLKAFSLVIKANYRDDLIQILCDQIDLKVTSFADENILRRFMFIGWNTEYLVSQTETDTEMIRAANHWKPIQAYYAVYSLAEALVFLSSGHLQNNHSKCIDCLNELLINNIKLEPWCYAFTGNMDSIQPINFPSDSTRISNLANTFRPIDMIHTCLIAEHRNQIDEYPKRKGGPLKKLYDPSSTTVIDFLYRLRIKSNYKDVEIFIADASEDQIRNFSRYMNIVVYSTMCMLEVAIIKRCGYPMFSKLLSKYSAKLTKVRVPVLERNIAYHQYFSR